MIIDTQDTIIKQLELNIRYYDELVEACDSVMTNQNHLIELKDSVIMIQRNELNDFKKKKKRRKLGEIIAGIGILTLLIEYSQLCLSLQRSDIVFICLHSVEVNFLLQFLF